MRTDIAHDGSARAADATPSGALLEGYLNRVREHVLEELREIVPADSRKTGGLYALMLDYPLRGGKSLRPALCLATCRALGGSLASALRPAAVLELYHNAFLIHDDVEDRSSTRRSEPTLHETWGVPIAVNVGDGMLALCMEALLDGLETLGVGKTLRIYRTMARMARETAEGQMIELQWVRSVAWSPSDREYVRMVYKKTAWYSFIAPMLVGAAAAARTDVDRQMHRFASLLGIAFQIRDDLLNLAHDVPGYGKERAGDLWEGKHTLILASTLRRASAVERTRAAAILQKPRGGGETTAAPTLPQSQQEGFKTPEDIDYLLALIERYDGVAYAAAVASRYAARARSVLRGLETTTGDSSHMRFIAAVVDYVIDRRD